MPARGNPNWKKGVSANPLGRPKGSGYESIAGILERQGEYETPEKLRADLAEVFPEVAKRKERFSLKEALCLSAYTHAIQGQSWALNFIADRTEGKAKQSIDVTTNDVTDLSRLSPDEIDQRIKELRERLAGHIEGDA